MLDVLGEMNVSATFFCVGEQVEWYPEIVSRAFDEGHVVGNHSMCHSRAQAMSVTGTSHLDRADRAIEQVIGRRPRFYRPPWGWLVPWEARRAHARGLTIVGWDVFPDDWKVPENPADVTTDQICSRVQPGSIVLMHDATSGVRHCTKSQSAVAARSVIWRLRSDGYEIVGLPELLGVEPYR